MLYRTFISLLESLIDSSHVRLLEINLGHDFVDMLIFDIFLFNFSVKKGINEQIT